MFEGILTESVRTKINKEIVRQLAQDYEWARKKCWNCETGQIRDEENVVADCQFCAGRNWLPDYQFHIENAWAEMGRKRATNSMIIALEKMSMWEFDGDEVLAKEAHRTHALMGLQEALRE